VYRLLASTHGIGTAAQPAPAALSFAAVAKTVQLGTGSLPASAMTAALIAMGLSILLTVLSRGGGGWRNLMPSPVATGVGLLVPPSFGLTIAMGAVVAALIQRRQPARADEHLAPLATGAITGESLTGVAIALAMAAGWLPT
jgi:uncharacterized oligopeptide transporter (OPT) family protein